MPAKPNDHGLEPLLANQQQQLGLLFDEGDSIDGKALAILGANVAILIFVNQTASGLMAWQYLALYGPFVVSLALDVLSIWPRKYRGPGVNPPKIPQYLNMARDALILQLFSDTQAAIEHNSRLNRQRLRTCIYSIVVTGLGFCAILLIL